jgi:flagellar hook assembly protein FlgD
MLDGNGYVRFHLGNMVSPDVEMAVYNFAMENVYNVTFNRQSPETGAIKWNGKDSNGRLVDNGVYFIKLKYSQNLTASPSNHWLKLIVVK